MIFAQSVAGVTPSRFITWFQAQQACANVGKRLPTNAEWQMAAAGTPDTDFADYGSTTCNTDNQEPGVSLTGSRENCVSNYGAFDMVGNVWEWVADWMRDNSGIDGGDESTALYGMDGIFGVNEATPEDDRFPAALIRGSAFFIGPPESGVFTLDAGTAPSISANGVGFRCARNR